MAMVYYIQLRFWCGRNKKSSTYLLAHAAVIYQGEWRDAEALVASKVAVEATKLAEIANSNDTLLTGFAFSRMY